MRQEFTVNVAGIVAGSLLGLITGSLVTAFCLGLHSPFWIGKGVEWITAIGTCCAAVITGIAIYYAASGNRRSVENAMAIHQAQRDILETERRAQAAAIFPTIIGELTNVLGQCYEYMLLLRCAPAVRDVTSAYIGSSEFSMPAVARIADRPEIFNGEAAMYLCGVWAEVERLKIFARVNAKGIASWGAELEADRSRVLAMHLFKLVETVRLAMRSASESQGESADRVIKAARSQAINYVKRRREVGR